MVAENYKLLQMQEVFINVPWYFSVLYTMISPFLTQRTKSKFVIASEGKVAETLYKFIPPENIPFQYGGLSRPKDVEFGPQKHAAEFTIRADGSTVVWDLVVGGWNVTYLAEFVPSAEGNYSVLIEKSRMMSPSDEPIFNSFKACEAGKVVLVIDNTLSNRKKVAAYSDKPRVHNFDLLRKLVLSDGSISRARLPGRPTADFLFNDPSRDGKSLLKIWNMKNYTGVLGAFSCQGATWSNTDKMNIFHDKNSCSLTGSVRAKKGQENSEANGEGEDQEMLDIV